MTNPEIAMCKLLGKHKLKKVSQFKLVCSNCGCEFVDDKEIQKLLEEITNLQVENNRLKKRIDELTSARKLMDSYPDDISRYKDNLLYDFKMDEPKDLFPQGKKIK
jgi:regulator of replication initiation timing